ncbi:MAG TPA: flagellar basal body rod protein FlgB [Bacteroidales bacterium]|nr:flagellar basal body rod protein FlgB [Bacteroidales bacterium]
MKLLENVPIKLLTNAMDAYSLRQKMTAANIANIDTPGYTKKTVSFENELRQAKELKGKKALDGVKPRVENTNQKPILDNEMMKMADTQMRTQLVTRSLREHFNQLRSAIKG